MTAACYNNCRCFMSITNYSSFFNIYSIKIPYLSCHLPQRTSSLRGVSLRGLLNVCTLRFYLVCLLIKMSERHRTRVCCTDQAVTLRGSVQRFNNTTKYTHTYTLSLCTGHKHTPIYIQTHSDPPSSKTLQREAAAHCAV